MIGYAQAEIFTSKDVDYLERAAELVARAPAKIDGDWVRCHELARAVAEVLELPAYDGRYGACEHSWIVTPDGAVLDVYVPARVPQVQLVDARAPWALAEYRTGAPRDDVREDVIGRLRNMFNPTRDVDCGS